MGVRMLSQQLLRGICSLDVAKIVTPAAVRTVAIRTATIPTISSVRCSDFNCSDFNFRYRNRVGLACNIEANLYAQVFKIILYSLYNLKSFVFRGKRLNKVFLDFTTSS